MTAAEPPRSATHASPLYSVDFRRDGLSLVTGDAQGEVQLWQPTGELIQSIPAHDSWINRVRFNPHPDLNFWASASENGEVRFWTWTGEAIRSLPVQPAAVRDLDFHPNGVTMALALGDGSIRLVDLFGAPKLPPLAGHQDRVLSVRFSPDGKRLASAGDDGKVRLWQTTDGALIAELLSPEPAPIYQVEFSPDGHYIVGALQNGWTVVWDQQGTLVSTVRESRNAILDISFSPPATSTASQAHNLATDPSPGVIATSSLDGTVRFWQIDRSPRLQELALPAETSTTLIGVSVSPQADRVVATRDDGQVLLWDLSEPLTPTARLLPGGEFGVGIHFSPQGDRFASADTDGTIRQWSSTGEPLPPIPDAHEGGVYTVRFNPTAKMLASGGGDGLVKLWDSASNLPQTLEGHTALINNISFSPNGSQLASADDNGTVNLWDAQSGKLLASLEQHEGPVIGVAYSPAGDLLATAGADQTVKLWDSQGNFLRTFTGHLGTVNSVQFSPQGELLFSASDDHTIKVWQLDDTLVMTLNGHTEGVNDLSTDHTDFLTSASSDGKVILWNVENLSLDGLIAQGCTWLSHYLQTDSTQSTSLCQGQ